MTNAKQILETAAHIVTGARQAEYGKPEDNFARIAAMWGAYTGRTFTAAEVAWMMVLLKVARAGSGAGVTDNAIDAAGYAALGGQLEAEAGK